MTFIANKIYFYFVSSLVFPTDSMETLLSLMNDNTTNTLEEVFLQEEKIDRFVMTC